MRYFQITLTSVLIVGQIQSKRTEIIMGKKKGKSRWRDMVKIAIMLNNSYNLHIRFRGYHGKDVAKFILDNHEDKLLRRQINLLREIIKNGV